jgi:acetyl esterase/lipase
VAEQRVVIEEMTASTPLADDVTTCDATLGGIEAMLVETSETRSDRVVLYLHGGAYALGSARVGVGLASEVARRASARAYSIDYRLAPEHPYPAGVDDCVAAYRGLLDSGLDARQIAIVGESAGAGVVAAMLVRAEARGLPQPACVGLMSPWVDLTLTSATLDSKADVDPLLSREALRRRADDYVTPADARAAVWLDAWRSATVASGSTSGPMCRMSFSASRACSTRASRRSMRWARSSTAGSPRSIPRGLREGLLELVDRLTRPHEPMSRSVPTSRSEHPLEQLAMLAGRDQIVWIANRRVRTLALTPMRRTADCGSLPAGVGPTSGDGES